MIRFFIVTIMFILPTLQTSACQMMSDSEKQDKFVKMLNSFLELDNRSTLEQLQNLTVIELSTTHPSHLSKCQAELFEYLFTDTKKYLNVSNIWFQRDAYHTLIRTLNATSKLDYVFVLDQKSYKSPKTEHYNLVDNNDYGWCKTIEPDWLEKQKTPNGCQITEAVPVCKIDMTNQALEGLITKIKNECGSAKLVHVTNLNNRMTLTSLKISDDLPVNTVYFEGPGTLEFVELAPNQAAMILSGNKKLYLKNITLRSHNNKGIGIHVKNGELRLQGTLIDGFDYGVILEKGTSLYTWHERLGYQRRANGEIEERRNDTRIHANHTGVMLYQTTKGVFVNTQLKPQKRAIAIYDSPIQKNSNTHGNMISLNQSDWARHSFWLQGEETEQFLKIDAHGKASNTNWDCVIDRKTGLTWKAHEFSSTFTFDEAVKKAQATELCELKKWRLPTVEELYWLAERTNDRPAIDTQFFPKTKNDDYWSSTPVMGDVNKRWTVNFRFGIDNHQPVSKKQRLRLVSGDTPFKKWTKRFQKVKDAPCIEDTLTQMMWLVPENMPHYRWYQHKEKLAYINKVNKQKICGFSDWRIPQPESLYLLANKQSSDEEILASGNYWLEWPNRQMFKMGSLSFPKPNNVLFPYEAYLLLVRGKRNNFVETRP